MEILRNEIEIKEIKDKRQALEAEVANKLGDYLFEQFEWEYKGIVHGLYQQFLNGVCFKGHGSTFEAFLQGQTAYDMWKYSGGKPYSWEGLGNIYQFVRICHDKTVLYVLSDFVRLAGEWIEKCHEKQMVFIMGAYEGKEHLKPKPTFQKPLACPVCKSERLVLMAEGPVRSSFRCCDPKHETRAKELLKNAKSPADKLRAQNAIERNGIFSVDTPLPAHRVRGENPAPTQNTASYYWSIAREHVKLRGIERWRLERDSVIRSIDKTYGLPEGGDVSGTTTDSMWILKSIHDSIKQGESDPNLWALQLIAIATMVHSGHHTIAECAYPLTRHNVIDYKIGFYSSLTPKSANIDRLSRHHVEAIDGKLSPYDYKVPHVMVWKESLTFGSLGVKLDDEEAASLRKTKFFDILSAYSMCAAGPFPSTIHAYSMLNLYDKNLSEAFLSALLDDERSQMIRIIGQKVYAWAKAKGLCQTRGIDAPVTV